MRARAGQGGSTDCPDVTSSLYLRFRFEEGFDSFNINAEVSIAFVQIDVTHIVRTMRNLLTTTGAVK